MKMLSTGRSGHACAGWARNAAIAKALFLVVLVAGVLSGCAEIPQQQFQVYLSAFGKARGAAEEVLADYSAAEKQLAELEAKVTPTPENSLPYPIRYEPATGEQGQLDAVAVRFLALEAVSNYNDALAQLASGQSVDAAQSSIGKFAGVVGQIAVLGGASLPNICPAIQALQTLVGVIEKARLAGEFRKAVRDGAPVVAQIFDVLREDTRDHYGLRFALANREHILLEAQGAENQVVKNALEKNEAGMRALKDTLDSYNNLLLATKSAILNLAKESAKPAEFDATAARLIEIATQLKRDLAAYHLHV